MSVGDKSRGNTTGEGEGQGAQQGLSFLATRPHLHTAGSAPRPCQEGTVGSTLRRYTVNVTGPGSSRRHLPS